jgi:hypothetical protein
MPKAVKFIGDAAGSWTEDSWNPDTAFAMIAFENAKPARTTEFNLVQQDAEVKRRDFTRQLLTDGWSTLGAYAYPGTPTSTFLMGESWYNVNGQPANLHIGNPDAANNASTIALGAPPVSGTAQDLVFLEIWAEEVAAIGSTDNAGGPASRSIYKWGGVQNNTFANAIYWNNGPNGSVEPSRRIQVRWALRVVRGVTNLTGVAAQGSGATVSSYTYSKIATATNLWTAGDGTGSTTDATRAIDGVVLATPIALVTRAVGVSVITPNAVTDLRNPEQLAPGVVVPIGNITPSPVTDPVLTHLAVTHFVYEGQSLGAYNISLTPGAMSQESLLTTSGFATRLVLPTGVVNLPITSTGAGIASEGGTLSVVTRATATLAKIGAGAAVTIKVMADGGGAPDPTRTYSTFVVPASWLQTSSRDISVPVFNCAVPPLTALWVVVLAAGDNTNGVTLLRADHADAAFPGATSPDGVAWTTGAPAMSCALFGGDSGNPVVVVEGGVEVTLIEYDKSGNPIQISEAYQPQAGSHLIPFDTSKTIYYGPSANPIDIA